MVSDDPDSFLFTDFFLFLQKETTHLQENDNQLAIYMAFKPWDFNVFAVINVKHRFPGLK